MLGKLQDLLPNGISTDVLTPQGWHDKKNKLIENCTEEYRALFLFDQELNVDRSALGFSKGSDIILDMEKKEKAGFGTRWFCGILTHTVEQGNEVVSWHELAKSEKLDLRFFMPIAKTTLDDAHAFYGAVYRALINIYCQTMKCLAQKAFEEALKDTLERFASLDPVDFEHAVVRSSQVEGVSELETLIRLYGIIQKDQIKLHILKDTMVGDFAAAARSAKDIADIGRELSPTLKKDLYKLRREELYERNFLVNSYNTPLRNGDLFKIGEGNSSRTWVLIAQPCDLMVRSNGKRSHEENFKVTALAPINFLEKEDKAKPGASFLLKHYGDGDGQFASVSFTSATPANLLVLDLAVFNKEGRCELATDVGGNLNLPSRSWQKRADKLRKDFGRIRTQIEEVSNKCNDDNNSVADKFAAAIIPRAAPNKNFVKYGAYENGKFSYPIRRCGRIRDPLAASLLMAYSRFLARDAYEHDFSKVNSG